MMTFEELKRRINVTEALRIHAIKTGKYHRMCAAYVHAKKDGRYVYASPDLKYAFDSEMMPLLESICGDQLGENPFDPNHPVQRWKNYQDKRRST